jgi:hypothetical protein
MRTAGALLATFTASLLLSAGPARAISFYFEIVSGTPTVGSPLTLDLWVDVQADPLVGFGLQVSHAGNTATSVATEPFIVVDAGLGIIATPLVSPVANSRDGGTASGQWSYVVTPPYYFEPGSPPFKYGSIHFASLAPGVIEIEPGTGGFVDTCPSDVCIFPIIEFDSITIVPEPASGLLFGVALAGLALVRRQVRTAPRATR